MSSEQITDLEPWLSDALCDDDADLIGDLDAEDEEEEPWDEDAEEGGDTLEFTCHCGFEGNTWAEYCEHRACKAPKPTADDLFAIVNRQAISPEAREALRQLLALAKR